MELGERHSAVEVAEILEHLGGFFDAVRLVDAESGTQLAFDDGGRLVSVAQAARDSNTHFCSGERAGGEAFHSEVPRREYRLVDDAVFRTVSRPVEICQDGRLFRCVIEAVSAMPIADFAGDLGSDPALGKVLLDEIGRAVDRALQAANAHAVEGAASLAGSASEFADFLESVPEDAADPLIVWLREFARRESARPTSSLPFPMPLMDASFQPGQAEKAVAGIGDATQAALARIELQYLRGSFDDVVRETESLMRDANDPVVRATAGLWNMMANMSCGHPGAARRMKGEVEALCWAAIQREDDPRVCAQCSIVDSTIVSYFFEGRAAYAPLADAIGHLPDGQRLYASYLVALQAFNLGEYGNSLGVANTALAYCTNTYPVSMAYLHIVAACDYMALHRPEEAAAEFDQAWQLASADGFVSPFIDHYVQLQGLVEACLKKADPVLYRCISKTAAASRMGWISIVDSKEADLVVGSGVTAPELAVSALAKRGWANREIAALLDVSVNTVKHRLSAVFQKLGISRRSDLAAFKLM